MILKGELILHPKLNDERVADEQAGAVITQPLR